MISFWFPPRLVQIDDNKSADEQCDMAVKLYLDEGIALKLNDEVVQDAFKVINFSKQFPHL